MKTATVRELRNHYTGLLKWLEAGEEVRITRRGKPIARLVPEPMGKDVSVDWKESPAVRRDRSESEPLTPATVRQLLEDSSGQW
jgi:prevent-host-death family protein